MSRRPGPPVPFPSVGLALAVVVAGCTGGDAPGAAGGSALSPDPSPFVQTRAQVRGDAGAPLAEDVGWAADPGEIAVVAADRPFRIRFEVEAPAGAAPQRFHLEARRNDGGWQPLLLRDFPYPDELSTPRVSLVRGPGWGTGVPTTDLLAGSELPFVPGEAPSDTLRLDGEGDQLAGDSATAPWPPRGEARPVHGEWEWAVVVRRFADSAVVNEAGDRFTFRMVDGDGRPVLGGEPARVRVGIPDGLLGGTYVETPGVLGPWQDDAGALYFPMEPAETWNVFMMVRSTDGGRSWSEFGGAGRPLTDDLEGVGTAWHDGTIHVLHQISEATVHHAFATPDAPGDAEGWVLRDRTVAEHSEPPTQVAALTARDDGSLVAVYGDSTGLLHRVRSVDGAWGDEGRVPVVGEGVASGVMAALGDDGDVHLAYTVTAPGGGSRDVRHRILRTDGTFGPERRLAGGIDTADDAVGAVAPLGRVAGTGTMVVAYRLADGALMERRVRADGSVSAPIRVTERRVVQSAADSEQVGADLVVHDGIPHLVFIDEDTRDLWYTRSPAPGSWTPAEAVVEGVDAEWVRGRVIDDADGRPVYGIVYDAGSGGGSGMNRFVALPLDAGG